MERHIQNYRSRRKQIRQTISDHIDGYINVNQDRVNTYQAVDLNRRNT